MQEEQHKAARGEKHRVQQEQWTKEIEEKGRREKENRRRDSLQQQEERREEQCEDRRGYQNREHSNPFWRRKESRDWQEARQEQRPHTRKWWTGND